jgi:hypothetical protein
LVREIDVKPSHPDSSPQERRFGFLLLKEIARAFPTVFISKKILKIRCL